MDVTSPQDERGLPDWVRRPLRTLAQLIVGGGLTAVVAAISDGLAPATAAVWMAIWTVVVTVAQNYLEDNTAFPAVLKAPPSPGVNPQPPDAT